MGPRERRLVQVLAPARRGARVGLAERWLFVIGAAFATTGVALVVVGWVGTSRTVLVAGQIPYVVSGGLLGLAFVFLGGFLYFGYWLAVGTREAREQAAAQTARLGEISTALGELSRAVATLAGPGVAAPGAALVATPAGSMAHDPSCPVVANRGDVRPVLAGEGLAACAICGSTS